MSFFLYLLIGFLSGFSFAFLWEKTTLKIGQHAYQKGYHFHHSLFALPAFLLIPFFWGDVEKILFIIGFGLGIIIQHSIKERLTFITKEDRPAKV